MNQRKTGDLLFLAMISFMMIPKLLLAIFFGIQQHSLAKWIPLTFDALGFILGMFFLLLAFMSEFYNTWRVTLIFVKNFLRGMLPALFCYLLFTRVLLWLFGMPAGMFESNPVIYLSVTGVCAFGIFVMQGLAFCGWCIRCKGFSVSFRRLFRKPLWTILIILLTGFTDVVPGMVYLLTSLIPWAAPTGIGSGFLITLLITGIQSLCLLLLLRLVCHTLETETDAEEKTETLKSQKQKRFPIVYVLSGMGILVIFLTQGFISFRQNPVTVVRNDIEDNINEAYGIFFQGNLEGAIKQMEEAKLTVDVWAAVIGMEDAKSLNTLLKDNKNSALVNYIYCMQHYRTDELEEYFKMYSYEPELCLALLDIYAQQEELTPVQKIYQNEAVAQCMQAENYVHVWFRPDAVEGYEEELSSMLHEFSRMPEMIEMMEVFASIAEHGDMTSEMVKDTLKTAEKYPDNWMLQYVAAYCGSSYAYDGANHYAKTIQAAIRFEELYCQEVAPEGDDLCNLELMAAKMIYNCYGYEQAIPYLQRVIDMGEIQKAYPMTAACYEALEQYSKCYELSLAMLEKDERLAEAHYYAAISALKAGMVEEALEQTSYLADLAKESTKGDFSADIMLYSMLQYLAVDDSAFWTKYQYEVYEQLTPSQWEIINKNPFFEHYLNAVYYCFWSKEKGHYESALEEVEHVLEQQVSLPQAWYLKGTVLFEMKDYEESVSAYKNSLEIEDQSATVWYALANVYDRMEEYELAYEACERVMAILPMQDHGSDWYGVSVHSRNLMSSLEREIGGK